MILGTEHDSVKGGQVLILEEETQAWVTMWRQLHRLHRRLLI